MAKRMKYLLTCSKNDKTEARTNLYLVNKILLNNEHFFLLLGNYVRDIIMCVVSGNSRTGIYISDHKKERSSAILCVQRKSHEK